MALLQTKLDQFLKQEREASKRAKDIVGDGMSKPIEVKSNIVYQHLMHSDKRITVLPGGSRSGKTYNAMMFFIIKLLSEEGKVLSICRGSQPTLRGTVLRDMQDIMEMLGVWDDDSFKKNEMIYLLGSNIIEFISTDQPGKIRGRKRNYLFLNEATEIVQEAAFQLILRTTDKIVVDYNPSADQGWFYDIINRPDADCLVTNYQDNPFLPQATIDEIERLKEADQNQWRIYGLGQRGVATHLVYSHWKETYSFPKEYDEVVYGLDFGFNSESCLVKIGLLDKRAFVQTMFYEKKLTAKDIILRLEGLEVGKDDPIYCDYNQPGFIEEIQKAGYDAIKADKDVTAGINTVKSTPLFVLTTDDVAIKELRGYGWQLDKNGNPMDKPVKARDHFCDSVRYGLHTHKGVEKFSWFVA